MPLLLGLSDETASWILHSMAIQDYGCLGIKFSKLGKTKRLLKCDCYSCPSNGIVWSSDEAHFHISGRVNKQNFGY